MALGRVEGQNEAMTPEDGATLLDRAVSRTPMVGHDGRSGAALEQVLLDDGTRLIVKTAYPADDLTASVPGGRADRELTLWATGVLDHLPAGVGHCIVEAFWSDGAIVTVMRDLGAAVVGWGRPLSREECRRVLSAAASVHARFADAPPSGLCGLEERLVLLGPVAMGALVESGNPLPAAVCRGWEHFDDLVPEPVRSAVAAIHADPSSLAGALRRTAPSTLIHGDLWLVNLALEPGTVTLLDWGMATAAPAVVDFASFLAGNSSQVQASREQIVADFRAVEGDRVTDESMRLGLLAGLVELGWNKALDTVENPDPEVRRRERADLDWWVAAALPALQRDL